MDWMQYTDARYWFDLLQTREIIAFGVGGAWGCLLGVAIALKKWWIPTILVLLPTALTFTSLMVPTPPNVTYRLFFLALPALASIAFAIWLFRRGN